MASRAGGRRVGATLVALAAILASLPVQTARAGPPVPERGLPAGSDVRIHRETGAVRFIGTRPGRPIPRPAGVGAAAPPASVARAFLARHGPSFGVRDQARELQVLTTRGAPGGRSSVRFQQVHRGIPVLGGEVVVNLDSRGNVLSAGGELLPPPRPAVSPGVPAREARRTAVAAVARGRKTDGAGLVASEPALWIHDSRLLGGPGLDRPTLVWRMDVTGPGPTDELVLVDAQLGNAVLRIDQIETALDRRICDAANADAHYPCVSPVRSEGDPAHAVADVNDAYDFSGDTYDFFFDRFGRDSLDGAGMALRSTVRWCPPPTEGGCPYQNAFWDGSQMVYGLGFASADDVVGHELMHGVTDHTSRLFYYYQSGAINESLSDVFGEFVDLTNGVGTDTPAVRWLLGEDLSIGAIRDMEHPPTFGDPDRMTSPNYWSSESDAGGVHANSGVNNKAAFLMTDGGSFNGQTVTGLGIDKVAHIYYEVAANMLTSASDYADLASALPQACTNLIGTDGIGAEDCTEVADAVTAVEMATMPPSAPNPEAPVCDPGGTPTDLFFDDLENPATGNWTLQTEVAPNTWHYPQNPNLFSPDFDATYATSGTTNFWGYDRGGSGDFSIAMAGGVAIPIGAATYLHFAHAYGFDNVPPPPRAWDGGVVEYRTEGDPTWSDAGGLFTHQGYNGSISSQSVNPLAGRPAFVRESNGYISSRADLSSLGGQTVRFRFRIGTDSNTVIDDYGWFVDDIRIYTCTGAPDTDPPETTITAGPDGPTNDATPQFTFSSNENGSTFECRVDADAFEGCTSPHTVSPALADGPHTFEVRATDPATNTDPTPASRSFTVDTVPPSDPSLSSPSHTPSTPSSDDTVEITWSGAADTGGTGVDGFSYAWDTSPSTVPNQVKDAEQDAAGTTSDPLPDGTSHWFHLRTVDNAGNWTSTVHLGPFAIDTHPPAVTNLTSPKPNGAYTTGEVVDVEITFEEAVTVTGTPQLTLETGPTDGVADYQAGSGTDTLTFGYTVAAGHNTPDLDAAGTGALALNGGAIRDAATNDAVLALPAPGAPGSLGANKDLVIDTQAPSVTIDSGPSGPTNVDAPTFGFSSDEDGSTFACRVDTDPFAPCASPHPTGVLAEAAHTFEVRATDQAGNVSPAEMRSFTVDTTSPTNPALSSPTHVPGVVSGDPAVEIAWSGAVDTGGTGVDGFSHAWSTAADTEPDPGKNAEESATGTTSDPLPDGSHWFHLRTVDAAGNWSPAVHLGPFLIDTGPPTTSIESGPSGPTGDPAPTFTFTSTEGGSTFECRVDDDGWSACDSPHTHTVSPALADGPHTFAVRAIDVAGNIDPDPPTRAFTVDTEPPSSAFAFPLDGETYTTAGFAAGCGTAGPDLCGNASDAAGTGVAGVEVQVQRQSDGRYWNGATWQADAVWNPATDTAPWSLTFAPGEDTYTAAARATDEAGNVEATAIVTFTVEDLYKPDALIRLGRKAFRGDDVYNTNAASQTWATRAKRGQARTFTLRFQNDGDVTDSFGLAGPGVRRWVVRYVHAGDNVTAEVVAGTFTLEDLAPGSATNVKLRIKPKRRAPIGSVKNVLVTAASLSDETARDAVRARVKVRRG